MKKIVTGLTFCFIALFAMSSCEGPMGPEGPQGPQGPSGTSNWYTQTFLIGDQSENVHYGYWKDLGNGHYECLFQISALTNFVYEEGIVTAHIFDYDADGNEVQIGLPHIFFGSDGGSNYTAAYTYDITPGEILFKVAYSDFASSPPPTRYFRVAMIW